MSRRPSAWISRRPACVWPACVLTTLSTAPSIPRCSRGSSFSHDVPRRLRCSPHPDAPHRVVPPPRRPVHYARPTQQWLDFTPCCSRSPCPPRPRPRGIPAGFGGTPSVLNENTPHYDLKLLGSEGSHGPRRESPLGPRVTLRRC